MKKYIGVVAGVVFAIGSVSIASAGITICKFGMLCSDGGGGLDGGGFSQCTNTYGRVINWRFTDFEGGYERCEWGPPPRFSDKPDGSFALLGGCQSVACGGLKSASALVSAPAVSHASSPSLTPKQAELQKRVLDIVVRSVAPSVSAPVTAYSAVAGVVRTATPSVIAPAAVRGYPVNAPAYTAPTPRASVTTIPPVSYYSQWANPRPTPKTCDAAKDQVMCLVAAAAVQGNSTGMPKNTCEWSDDFRTGEKTCKMVQLQF